MKLTVTRQELLASLLFASQDDSRYVLNGVLLIGTGKAPLLVSTDGRRLAVIESSAVQSELTEGKGQVILKSDFVKSVCALSKAIGEKLYPWLTIEVAPGSKRIQCEIVGCETWVDCRKGGLIEGDFPKWRGVIPAKNEDRQPVSELGFNAAQIGDFAAAAKRLECDNPLIQIAIVGKDKAIEVKLAGYDGFYGLVMPCRLQDDVNYQPEFLGIVEDLPKQETNTDTKNT